MMSPLRSPGAGSPGGARDGRLVERSALARYAWLSVFAAVTTIGLKGGAYWITGSVGLLSDALESLVNLVAALAAMVALSVAARPPDEEHAYGHGKAEYLSSGFEGALILVAAGSIAASAVDRLLHPRPIEDAGLGLAITVVATAVNWGVARALRRAGRDYHSVTLEADAEHLMTDVWTSAGVVLGVGLAALTDWELLDPIVAIAVAIHILRSGVQLVRRSALGLLDTALDEEDLSRIRAVLDRHTAGGVQFHALRTRQSGAWRFASFHVLVPGDWSVQRGHDLLERVEDEVRAALPAITVFTHLEPIEDPASFEDTRLDRGPPGVSPPDAPPDGGAATPPPGSAGG